jgi:hypothetical protein
MQGRRSKKKKETRVGCRQREKVGVQSEGEFVVTRRSFVVVVVVDDGRKGRREEEVVVVVEEEEGDGQPKWGNGWTDVSFTFLSLSLFLIIFRESGCGRFCQRTALRLPCFPPPIIFLIITLSFFGRLSHISPSYYPFRSCLSVVVRVYSFASRLVTRVLPLFYFFFYPRPEWPVYHIGDGALGWHKFRDANGKGESHIFIYRIISFRSQPFVCPVLSPRGA